MTDAPRPAALLGGLNPMQPKTNDALWVGLCWRGVGGQCFCFENVVIYAWKRVRGWGSSSIILSAVELPSLAGRGEPLG